MGGPSQLLSPLHPNHVVDYVRGLFVQPLEWRLRRPMWPGMSLSVFFAEACVTAAAAAQAFRLPSAVGSFLGMLRTCLFFP